MYQLKSETFQRFCCFLIPLAALLSGGTEVCAGDDTNGEIEIVIDFDGNGTVDPGEEYLAFRIWEEMNGIDEDEELDEILDIPEE